MFIGGERITIDPDRSIGVSSPITGLEIGQISDATAPQARAAIEAAEEAFLSWRRTSGAERARLMHKFADLIDRETDALARLETADNGKLLKETATQVRFAAR